MENQKRTCIYCNKTLKAIGQKRVNGCIYKYDSDKRQYHTKCLKEHCKQDRMYEHCMKMHVHGSLYDMIK